jgi:hypothetical protein
MAVLFEQLQRVVQIQDTKTNLTSLTGTVKEVITALATDTNEIGVYDGTDWVWIGGANNLKASALSTRFEPVTYNEEILFYNGDVVMMEVAN